MSELHSIGEVFVDGGAVCVVPAQPEFGRRNTVAVPVPRDSCYWVWMEMRYRSPHGRAWWKMLQNLHCAALCLQRWDQAHPPMGVPGCWPLGWIETHDSDALLVGEAPDLFPEDQVGDTGVDRAYGARTRSRGGVFYPVLHGRTYEPGVCCTTGYGDGAYAVQVAADARGATDVVLRFIGTERGDGGVE